MNRDIAAVTAAGLDLARHLKTSGVTELSREEAELRRRTPRPRRPRRLMRGTLRRLSSASWRRAQAAKRPSGHDAGRSAAMGRRGQMDCARQ